MIFRPPGPNKWTWFSPWIIIGSVCLLGGILVFLAVKDVNREKEFTERALLSQADTLMHSVEAGVRAGMRGMGRGYRNQMLFEEIARQSDVVFMALVTSTGRIVAHSNPEEVGNTIEIAIPKPGETGHGFSEKNGRRFEVIHSFEPWQCQRGCGTWQQYGDWKRPQGQAQDLFIVVALDPTPYEDATRQDVQHTAFLFGTMLLIGAAGFISLVWAQHYRQARASLQNMRAFTSTVLNQMPVGLIMTDLNGLIVRTNEASHRILRGPRDVEGSGMEDVFPCLFPVLGPLKSGETIVDREIQCRVDDRTAVTLLVSAAVIHDGGSRATGCILLFSDITKIKQLEERLRRSDRLAGLGRLAAGVAHEIRNPLSSIKGFATILAGRCPGDEGSRELAGVMVKEVERLNRVISELLDFARPTDLNCRMTPFAELIGNSLRLIEQDAVQQGITITSSVEPGDLRLEVDPDRLSQVLLNLCLNAIHAMPDGGALDVRAFGDDGDAVIVVADTGTGISPEHLPHVFDPYFTTKPKGVGLGLANVHKFVEAHGGKMEVLSVPGKGTQFIIRLSPGGGGQSCTAAAGAAEIKKNEKTTCTVDFNSR